MHESVDDLDSFICHYQLTVVANQLLLSGDKFVATFLMMGQKPIVACESMSISHLANNT